MDLADSKSKSLALWQKAVLFAIAYVGCAEAGNYLSPHGGVFITFWLPAGLYLAVLLLNRTRDWPWLVLAILPANIIFDLFYGTKFLMILVFYSTNTIQAVMGAWLVRRLVAERPTLGTLKEFFGLLGLAAVFSAMLGSCITAEALIYFGLSDSFSHSLKTLWGSNAMAILVLTPFILTWFSRPNEARNHFDSRKKIAEACVLLAGLCAFVWGIVFYDHGIMSQHRFYMIPFLLWAGLRFGARGATAASLFLSLALAFFTVQFSYGLTPQQTASGEYVFMLQGLLAMANLVALVPAIVISERDRTLTELRESEARFRILTEAAFEGVSISEDGRILDMNDQGLKMFGYERDEMTGKKIVQLVAPESRDVVAEIVRTGREGIYEHRLLHKDGSVFDAEAQAKMLRSGDRVLRMTALRDITNRKRAEELTHMQMQVLEMLSGGKSLQEALDMLLRLIESQSPEMLCSILLLDADGSHIHHGAAPSLPADYLQAIDGATIGPNAGSCGMAAFERKAVLVADIENDPLWINYKKFALPHGLRACWSTPIFDETKNVLGTFAIYYRHTGLPGEWHLRLIAMATHTAAICIIKHRTEAERQQAVFREHQARAEYTLQLIASQEAERARVARELHDSLGQNLLLIKNHASLARTDKNISTDTRLEEISALISQSIAEVRQISHDLHPYQLDHLGLTRALAAMIDSAAEASGIAFERKLDSVDEIFSTDAATNLYRIVQESVNNILKHSRAKKVSVKLECDVREVQLQIADDGCGFNVPENANGGKGMGLKNIAARTRILNGILKMDSQPGRGTRIEVTIPIAEVE